MTASQHVIQSKFGQKQKELMIHAQYVSSK